MLVKQIRLVRIKCALFCFRKNHFSTEQILYCVYNSVSVVIWLSRNLCCSSIGLLMLMFGHIFKNFLSKSHLKKINGKYIKTWIEMYCCLSDKHNVQRFSTGQKPLEILSWCDTSKTSDRFRKLHRNFFMVMYRNGNDLRNIKRFLKQKSSIFSRVKDNFLMCPLLRLRARVTISEAV